MKLNNVIIFVGPPGSGKGTQGVVLAKRLKFGYFSMGAVLREYAAKKNDLGQKMRRLIDRGDIIPDYMIAGIFHDAVKKFLGYRGLIIDGFPREFSQINIFDRTMKMYSIKNIKVVYLDVPKSVLLARLKKRKLNEGRPDDNPKVVSARFVQYRKKTYPLVSVFKERGILVHIDGHKTMGGVFSEIIRKLKKP